MVSSPEIKNIPLVTSGKSMALVSPTRPTRGAFRDRHDALGGAVMDASASGAFCVGRKRRSVRRSRVVLAPRRWRQALREVFRKVTVANKPAHRGEHEVSRK